jgi:hypothetical protein
MKKSLAFALCFSLLLSLPPHVWATVPTPTPNVYETCYFNAKYYLEQNPDLAWMGSDTVALRAHWLSVGIYSGRLGSPALDPAWYLDNNPDVVRVFGYNFAAASLHYYQFGVTEGRQGSATFSVRDYITLHVDVARVFKGNLRESARHFNDFGYMEKRAGIIAPAATAQPAAQAVPGLLALLSVVPDVSIVMEGAKVSFTAVAQGGQLPILYYFRLLRDGSEYMVFSTHADAVNEVTLSREGTYRMEVTAKDANGMSAILLSPEVKVGKPGLLALLRVVPDASAVTEGARVSFTAVAQGGQLPILYYFRLLRDGNEYMVFSTHADAVNEVTLSREGTYRMEVTARDASGSSALLLSPEVKVRKPALAWAPSDLGGAWAVILTLTDYRLLDPDVVNQTELPQTIPQTWEVTISGSKGGSVQSDFSAVSPGTIIISGSVIQVQMAESSGKGMTTWDGAVSMDGGLLSMSGSFLLHAPGEIEFMGTWSAVKTLKTR